MPTKTNAKGPASKGHANHSIPKEIHNSSVNPSQATDTSFSGQKGQSQATMPFAKNLNQQPAGQATLAASDTNDKDGTVNRKKQKRRLKEAAKRAAEQQGAAKSDQGILRKHSDETNGYDFASSERDDEEQYEADDGDDLYYTDEAAQQNYTSARANLHPPVNGHDYSEADPQNLAGSKSKKKKKRAAHSTSDGLGQGSQPLTRHDHSFNMSSSRFQHQPQKDRIWNTSTAEERERIKEFWLSLREDDRRSLVKVEKEAVLKKMKEQQKHSCSCTVCGRKRTAIEEELEVLYDAYYEELEQYANHQHGTLEDGTPVNPRMHPHAMSRQNFSRRSHFYDRRSSAGRVQEIEDEDDGVNDEDDSEDVEEDGYSDEYLEPELEPEPTPAAADFFNFGNSLTVQGGILTVADDLLKNDGKKFIEMMEQLAERRMQREEDAQYNGSTAPLAAHNHADGLEEEIYDEEDEEEEYDSQEDDEFDEDEVETMTEEQRMEEGRRMFQIFAARMFEQRVLTAYREKVALERQQRLIEELDDESRIDAQREAKKAKEAQKKKDKKRLQKLAKDEEKAKREAEKAAEEAAVRALEEKKAEEQRLKKEEQRKKREAEKKLQEEEKARKENEKQRRLQEARDLQAEQERKQREQKEHERRKRDEVKKQEQQEREAKEKEIREKKDREAVEKREREARSTASIAAKEPLRKDDPTHVKPAVPPMHNLPKRQTPANAPATAALPPGLQPPASTSSHTSPHLPIATPIVPKAPTPVRTRQPSFQDSRTTSPKASLPPTSMAMSSNASIPLAIPPGNSSMPPQPKQPTPPQAFPTQPRYSPKDASPASTMRGSGMSPLSTTPGAATVFGSTISEIMDPHRTASYPPMSSPVGFGQHASFATTNEAIYPSGMMEASPFPHSRGDMKPPSLPTAPIGRPSASFGEIAPPVATRETINSQIHSRNTSTSSNFAAQTQPIARPPPMQHPPSATPYQQSSNHLRSKDDVDDLSNHLGSKALLDDDEDDIPLASPVVGSRRGSMAVGGPRSSRAGFAGPPGLPTPIGSAIGTARNDNSIRGLPTNANTSWSNQQSPFGNASNTWSSTSGFGRANESKAFAPFGGPIYHNGTARAFLIRNLMAMSCQRLSSRLPAGPHSSWNRIHDVHQDVQLSKPQQMTPVNLEEIIEMSEVAGNAQNGGGSFDITKDQTGLLIRYHPGRNPSVGSGHSDLGSPIAGGPPTFSMTSRPFHPAGGYPPSTGF